MKRIWLERLALVIALGLVSGCHDFKADLALCEGNGWCADGGSGTVGGIAAALGPCHPSGVCWETKFPHNDLNAITGVSDTDLWAVGEHGLVLHDDGSGWRRVEVQAPDERFTGAWLAAHDDLWLAGAAGVLRWDGTALTGLQPGNVTAIAGASTTDVWGVGYQSVQHLVGSTWTQPALPTGVPSFMQFNAVSVAPSGDAYLVGEPRHLLRWDPSLSQLVEEAVGTGTASFLSVWAAPDGEVFAGDYSGLVYRRLSGVWTAFARFMDTPALAISGRSASDVWVTSWDATTYHFNGSGWASVPRPTDGQGNGIWAGNDVTVVGANGVISRLHGGGWSVLAPDGPLEFLHGVDGSSAQDVWAVGNSGAVVHFDGAGWTHAYLPSSPNLLGVDVVSEGHAWAVGDDGSIHRLNGTTWSTVGSPATQLSGVWALSDADVWAAGAGGKVVRSVNGAAAQTVPMLAGMTDDLRTIFGFTPTDVWVAGNNGRVLHYDGSGWTDTPTGATSGINRVWGAAPGDVYAAGDCDLLLHWAGSGWNVAHPADCQSDYVGMTPDGEGGLWLVGEYGAVTRWTGNAGSPLSSGTSRYLTGVYAPAKGLAFIVGEGGAQLRYQAP